MGARMKSCFGCKYRVTIWGRASVCRKHDGHQVAVSPYDGRRTYWYELRPTLEQERAPGGAAGRRCGPDAIFYKPTLWQRLKDWYGSRH